MSPPASVTSVPHVGNTPVLPNRQSIPFLLNPCTERAVSARTVADRTSRWDPGGVNHPVSGAGLGPLVVSSRLLALGGTLLPAFTRPLSPAPASSALRPLRASRTADGTVSQPALLPLQTQDASVAQGIACAPSVALIPLAPTLTREKKAELRWVRNRLSAAKSNQKKRDEVEGKMAELACLTKRAVELEPRRSQVDAENQRLRVKLSDESGRIVRTIL